jgi:hypothetical protein
VPVVPRTTARPAAQASARRRPLRTTKLMFDRAVHAWRGLRRCLMTNAGRWAYGRCTALLGCAQPLAQLDVSG